MDMLTLQKEVAWMFRMGPRRFLKQCINASYSVISTYMVWKVISLLLNNDSPIVVVLSESMSPGFERGDILWLRPKEEYTSGDIVVFQLYKNTIPIVHRAIKRFGARTLTKGDNNRLDDVGLYRPNQYYLTPEDIKSSAFVYVPFFGMMTIWINTVPMLKFALLFMIGASVFLTKE